MTSDTDTGAIARAIIGSGLYMVLGTADADGNPWTSPVYYAHDGYSRFLWVSRPHREHSQNVARRPRVSIVIFNSGAAISTGQAVYMAAEARETTDAERDEGISVFSRRSQLHGAGAWAVDDVTGSAALRLYIATASEHWILRPGTDDRISVKP